MRRILKVSLEITDEPQEILMYPSAQIVHVANQYEAPTLWLQCSVFGITERRVFRVFGTGHEIKDDNLVYVGTAICASGSLVWHVFEQIEDEEQHG